MRLGRVRVRLYAPTEVRRSADLSALRAAVGLARPAYSAEVDRQCESDEAKCDHQQERDAIDGLRSRRQRRVVAAVVDETQLRV
jgi:hypothetical protein